MANYDQNVRINLDVNDEGVGSKLSAAAGELETFKDAVEGLDTDLSSAADSLDSFAKSAQKVSDSDIAPSLDMSNIEEAEEFAELADTLERVARTKEEVSDQNDVLSEMNEQTSETAKGEEDSFSSLIREADNLTDMKNAVGEANEYLSHTAEETNVKILEERSGLEKGTKEMKAAKEMLADVSENNKKLGDESEDTAEALDLESSISQSLEQDMDGLAGAKKAAANTNSKLGESAETTSDRLNDEFDITKKEADALAGLDEQNKSVSSSTRSLTRSISRMADETDSSTASLRAAAEVGDLFEDGLGSLSVNLGAFTIALRNFLTQVPLLLTALGGLGAAALAAASSLGVLAVATVGLFGAGLLANAQQLQSEFSQIDELGQSLEVIFQNLQDTFSQAIQPLMEISNVMSFFIELVEETAGVVFMVSDAIRQLTEGSQQLREFAEDVGVELYTIQDALDDIDGSSFQAVIGSLMQAWVLLGEEVVFVIGAINRGLADAIERSASLLAEVENISSAFSQFSDTISELAELGFTLGSGLLPIFESFSGIVEEVAASINELDDGMVAAGVTFGALLAASSKVAGTLSSVVKVIPSLVTGLFDVRAASQAAAGGEGLGALGAALEGVSSRVANFSSQVGLLGGIGELADASAESGAAFRELAFSTAEADAKFRALALNTPESADELKSLAAQGKLTQKDLKALKDTSDELGDSLGVRLKSALSGDQFEGVDASDLAENLESDTDEVRLGDLFEVDDSGRILASQFDNLDESVEDPDAGLLQITKTLAGFDDEAENSSEGLLEAAKSFAGFGDEAEEAFNSVNNFTEELGPLAGMGEAFNSASDGAENVAEKADEAAEKFDGAEFRGNLADPQGVEALDNIGEAAEEASEATDDVELPGPDEVRLGESAELGEGIQDMVSRSPATEFEAVPKITEPTGDFDAMEGMGDDLGVADVFDEKREIPTKVSDPNIDIDEPVALEEYISRTDTLDDSLEDVRESGISRNEVFEDGVRKQIIEIGSATEEANDAVDASTQGVISSIRSRISATASSITTRINSAAVTVAQASATTGLTKAKQKELTTTQALNLAMRNYLARANQAVGAMMVEIATRFMSIGTKKAEATATGLLTKATMKYLGTLNAMIGTLIGATLSTLGLASSELGAATATQILKGALDSLTGGLFTVITGVIALIVALGALAVGVMKNMEQVKGGFTSTLSVLGTIIGAVADLLMTVFVAAWEALKMTLMPILRPFKAIAMAIKGTGDAAGESSGLVRALKAGFDLLLSVVSGVIRVLGLLGKGIVTLLIAPFEIAAIVISALIDGLQYLLGVVGFAVTEVAQFFGLLQGKDAGETGFIDLIAMAIEQVASAIQNAGKMTEDFINDFIEDINNLIKTLNETPGINIAQVSKVDLTRDEATSTDQADVEPKKSNQITYNEDNSTNIDQTVDADPEDKAQLSRVVSDAIAQANSFERRRQGGQ